LRGGALGLLAYQVAGSLVMLRPRDARAQSVPLVVLSASEQRTLEALGDTLLPGAAAEGLAHYLDHQLAAPPADSLLMLRYLDVPPPYAAFYQPCLAAVDASCQTQHDQRFDELDAAERTAFVGVMQKGNPAGWQGPPAPFFYFVLRSDAVDVVYGTQAGFEKLGVPYMAHIPPATNW